jgi:hypothetical protein
MNMREEEAQSFVIGMSALVLLVALGKLFCFIVENFFRFLAWAWRKNPGLCNCLLTGVVSAGAIYYFMWRYETTTQWLDAAPWIPLVAGSITTGVALYLRYRIRLRAKSHTGQAGQKLRQPVRVRQPQTEFNAIESPAQRIVLVRNLHGATSPALEEELKRQGLDRLVQEARNVHWADQIIVAKELQKEPLQRSRLKSKLNFGDLEQNLNRRLSARF